MLKGILLLIIAAATFALVAAPSTNAVQTPGIVAIGDSVAAGAGLPRSSGPNSAVCDRSSQAYPYAVAKALGESVLQLACSGAKVDKGLYGAQTRLGRTLSPQIDRAFRYGTPRYIIGTVGANDMRWIEFIKKCYALDCGTTADNVRAATYRADLRYELTRLVYEMRQQTTGEKPMLYLGGYYVPFVDTSCVVSTQVSGSISANEQRWIAGQTAKLNSAIKSVANVFSDVEFVPVNFTGHEACSNDPWVQGLEATAPLHPNARGQAAIARSFVQAMD